MSKASRISPEAKRLVLDAHAKGQTVRQAADAAGVSYYAARDVYRTQKRKGKASLDAVTPEQATPPSADELNVPKIEKKDRGVETSIWTEKPLSVAEIAAMFSIDQSLWIAEAVRTNSWQGFYRTKEGHQKVTLYQTRVTWRKKIADEIRAALAEFCKSVPVAPKIPAKSVLRDRSGERQWAIVGLWDVHIGMLAWANEVGTSYDTNIAVSRVCNSIDALFAEIRRYNVTEIVLPIGNDWMHYDNVHRHTSNGDHRLDADTRFTHVYAAALRCASYLCDVALTAADRVEMMWIPGNHDTFASYTICAALTQRYKDNPRFAADISPSTRKYVKKGSVYIGFDHGKDVKSIQLANIFPREARVNWETCTYCEVQIGHTHQRRVESHFEVVPTNGVTVVTNPSLSNIDSYHHQHGYLGEPMKSAEAYRYNDKGRVGSHVAWADDSPHKVAKAT